MCEWIHECCLWACLCVSECVSTFLGEWMCEHMRVFAYIMWEWLCRFFVWACSLVNVFVSMSMCEWMHDHVCMWKVVFGNVSELMSTWLYVWVSMLIVCICEYICACDFVQMQVKSVISDDASTLTLITLMSVCEFMYACWRAWENIWTCPSEYRWMCECLWLCLCVSECATMLMCKWTHEHIHLC